MQGPACGDKSHTESTQTTRQACDLCTPLDLELKHVRGVFAIEVFVHCDSRLLSKTPHLQGKQSLYGNLVLSKAQLT